MAPPSSAVYHVTIAIRDTEESRASAGEPSCRSRHRSSASAAPRSALPRLSGSGLSRARSSPGSSLVARIGCAAPLSTASRAGAAHMRHGEGGRDLLPVLRPSASGHGPRGTCAPREAPLPPGARCGCSATSSVVPDGSRAFYHQPLPRLPPSAPLLELSEAAF